MTPEELKQSIRQVSVWRRGAERAPHKPLLLLYALGQYANGGERLIPYSQVDTDLREMLLEFGPERKSCHPEYPFWRLQNDGIWELSNAEHCEARKSNKDAKKSELLKYSVAGGFTSEVFDVLQSQPTLATKLAIEIMSQHFPPTYYEDLLSVVGLDIEYQQSVKKKRDRTFRERVLIAYEYRCCICGYDVRLGSQQVALEAAHIKWHQAGGPDVESNGLCLCSMHHKLFDRGVFTVDDQSLLAVSQRANGTIGLSEWLMSFHGVPLGTPQSAEYMPDLQWLSWHRREVFRGPARELAQ